MPASPVVPRHEPDRLVALVPGLLAVVLSAMALSHVVGSPTFAGDTWALVAGTAGAALAVVALVVRGRFVRGAAAHLLLALCLLAAAGDALLHLAGHGSLERTGEAMLVVACSGALLRSTLWYRGTVALVCAAWATAALAGPTTLYGFHGAAVLGSLAMARSVRLARLDSIARADAVAQALAEAEQTVLVQQGQLALAREEARAAAVTDPLTGLPDRNGLELIGKHLVAIARRESGAVGCTFVSVPGLEALRDEHGDEAADALFGHVASTLRSVTRGTDVVARWSENRLVVVTHGAGAPMEVLEQRVVSRLPLDCPVAPHAWTRELVLGRSVLQPWDDGGLVSLVAAADDDLHTRLGLPAPEHGTDAAAEAEAVTRVQAEAAAAQAATELSAELSADLDALLGADEARELVASVPEPAWATVVRLP